MLSLVTGINYETLVLRMLFGANKSDLFTGELWGIGSTPTCNKPPQNIDEMREVHPGNYVFNDYMQVLIGA